MWFWDWNRLYQYKPLFFCHCLIAFMIYLKKMIYCLCNLANIYVFVVSLLFWYTVVIVLGTLHLSWFVLLVTEQSDNYYSWVMHEITEVVVFEYSILVNYLYIAGNSFQMIKLWNWSTKRYWDHALFPIPQIFGQLYPEHVSGSIVFGLPIIVILEL